MRFRAVLAGLILTALALPVWAGEGPDASARRSISVQGLGVVSARPDMVMLQAGVTARAPSAKAALSEHNRAMAGLLAALKDFGVAAADVQTRQANLRPIYPNRQKQDTIPRAIAFQAVGNVRIRLRDVDRLGALLDRMTAVGANNLSVLGFTVADPAPLRNRARKLAVQDARRRAALYAAEAGVQLGKVLRISESGGGGPQMREFAALAVRAPNPIAPGETEIRAAVAMVFAIK